MTLESLFSKRQAGYLKELIRYAKIIMNDHFVLLLFLLLGAGGYAYSNYLDSLAIGMMEPRILLFFLYFLIVSTGSVTLLLEPADQIFLLPKEKDYTHIFKKYVIQSFLTSVVPLGLVVFASYPLLVATVETTDFDLLYLFLGSASLKLLHFLHLIQPFFEEDEQSYQRKRLFLLLAKIGGIAGLLFFHPLFVSLLLLVVALFYLYRFLTDQLYDSPFFEWDTMIRAEEKRMQRLYRFIGMFVTVPNIQTNIKRLAWMDGALNWLSQRTPNAPYYYVLRLVARNTEYSLMVVRATLLGALLLIVSETFVLSAVFIILFLYIVGFQLLSLVREMEKVPQFQMYPIESEKKTQAVLQLISQILLFVSILLSVASVVRLGLASVGILLIGVLFVYVFRFIYAPRRLQR